MNEAIIAMLAAQSAADQEESNALKQSQEAFEAQLAPLLADITKPKSKVPKPLEGVVQKMSRVSDGSAPAFSDLFNLLLDNPMLVPWVMKTATAKMNAINDLLQRELNVEHTG